MDPSNEITQEDRDLVETVKRRGFYVPCCEDCGNPIRNFVKGSRRELCDLCRGRRYFGGLRGRGKVRIGGDAPCGS